MLLDDVLTEASQRLHKMSKGRYELYRKEYIDDRRQKAGLELVVEDAYTGEQLKRYLVVKALWQRYHWH